MKLLLGAALVIGANLTFAETVTVTNTNDSGPGSLRQAILDAATGDAIEFSLPAPSTISLTSGELLVNKSLTITGPGGAQLTITANNLSRIFDIRPGLLDVVISGMTITGGLASHFGGGVLSLSTGTVEIRDCIIASNTAYSPFDSMDGANGGGVYNSGFLTLKNSTVAENQAGGGDFYGFGGGIENRGTLIVVNCAISGNSVHGSNIYGGSNYGGGINNSGLMVLLNVTIAGNSADWGFGGGVSTFSGFVSIGSCTFSGNAAECAGSEGACGGGGISASSNIQIANTIIAKNISSEDPDVGGALTSGGHNLIGASSGANVTPAPGDQIGSINSPIDPMLGPLQNNGGLTETQALFPGSPAIDKGGVTSVQTDQRGRFRTVDDPTIDPAIGDNTDIGAFERQTSRPLNISTRLRVLTGENVLDAGFIIIGTGAKRVLIRGLGPSMADAQVPEFLPDPLLELHDTSKVIATNDDWKQSQQAEIEASGMAPTNDSESAIIISLTPGAYTAILQGKTEGTGIGLVEVYDLDTSPSSTLANLSTRGFVADEDNIIVGGFIVGSGEGVQDRIMVRAIGPSLASAGIANPLADPKLELHDAEGGLIASNDNWKDTQESEIQATQIAPTDDKEAAILQTLPDGPYTAIVRGNDMEGVALVEVFDLH